MTSPRRKLALWANLGAAVLWLIFGFIALVISEAFARCGAGGIGGVDCLQVWGLFFVLPLILGGLPVIALLSFGQTARGFLWCYSVIISILFLPIGTVVGYFTIHALLAHDRPDV